MGQRIKICFLSVLLFLSCILTGCSKSNESYVETLEKNLLVPKIYEDLYVYDQGNFLSDDQEDVINNLLVQLEEKTAIEFAVITIPSLNSLTIEQYSVRLANKLGIGKEDYNNGILFLISKTDEEARLEIGTGLQGFLTDSVSGEILRKQFIPSREKGNYDDACFNTVNAVIRKIADSGEYNFSGISGEEQIITQEKQESLSIGDIILIIVIVMILLILEWITGCWLGTGFGDGIVLQLLYILINIRSGGGSSGKGSFGGGRFNGGGSSK